MIDFQWKVQIYAYLGGMKWMLRLPQSEVDVGIPGHGLSGGQPDLVDVGGRRRLHQGQKRSEAGDEGVREETEQTDWWARRSGQASLLKGTYIDSHWFTDAQLFDLKVHLN